MYKIVGSPMTRAFRVIWCLEELGLDFELVGAKPHSAEINDLNPSGKVPALIVDDQVIVDSTAICQFLADKQNALTFRAGTIERAQQDSWTQFILDEIDGALWQAAKHSFALPENLRCSDAKPAAKFDFDRALKTFEQRLGDNQFVMGDTFTIPDLIVCHCANWAQYATKWPLPQGQITDYITRIRQRPAYKKALALRK